MTIYEISFDKPWQKTVHFNAQFECSQENDLTLQLPIWRPGRYELGNFAKYLLNIEFKDERGEKLRSCSRNNHSWSVNCSNSAMVTVEYNFYAGVLNAGSCWLDEEQLYLNPVNCMLFNPQKENDGFELRFSLPDDYEIACGLANKSKHILLAESTQELMDGPLIASNKLEHWEYSSHDISFHLWFMGEHQLVKQKVLTDFKAFTNAQIEAFGGFPVNEYHFLFQFPKVKTYHGVEHVNSTVIALGPGDKMHEEKNYENLLGISCHELYHTWNIKNIRPVEMMPYDFTKENYSFLGYVAEGVTTYFGDEFLHRSGVFTDKQWLSTMEGNLNRHFNNFGRFNKSVAQSSFETWLDGYEVGIPNRKVSIYTEGCLIAFICDQRIKSLSGGTRSLDDVMKLLYETHGLNKTGYSEENYLMALEKIGETSFRDVYDQLIHGTEDYSPFLQESFDSAGIEWTQEDLSVPETLWGVRSVAVAQGEQVIGVYPGSPADRAGLWFGDVLMKIEGQEIDKDWKKKMGKDEKISLEVKRNGGMLRIYLNIDPTRAYFKGQRLKTRQLQKNLN